MTFYIFMIVATLAALGVFALLLMKSSRQGDFTVANAVVPGTVTPSGPEITRKAEEAIAIKHLVLTQGTADDEVLICDEDTKPMATALDTAAIDGNITVGLLAIATETRICIANAAIAVDADVFAADDGEVEPLPVGAGDYWCIGTARTAADADQDQLLVETCKPYLVNVSG